MDPSLEPLIETATAMGAEVVDELPDFDGAAARDSSGRSGPRRRRR